MHHQTKRLFTMMGIIKGCLDVRAQITGIGSMLAGFVMMMGAPAWAVDAKAPPSPTVSLTQSVHFTNAKGEDLVVRPGDYRLEVAGKFGLKLTPADGTEPIIIEGQAGSVKAPAALSVSVNEQEHHLILLLPKGKVIEVVGSPSGIRSREVALKVIVSPRPTRKTSKTTEVKDSHDRYADIEISGTHFQSL